MFTINSKAGYAFSNGQGQTLVFATEDDAEAYLASRGSIPEARVALRATVTIAPIDFRSA
jgi:hypothetical protein